MNNFPWSRVWDTLINRKYLFVVFTVALCSFIVYYFGLLPQYNSWLLVCSLSFSVLFFVRLFISAFHFMANIFANHSLNKSVEHLVDDPLCFKILYRFYAANGNPLDFDNLNSQVISLVNAGLIYKVKETPIQYHDNFDMVSHEYSAYQISSLGMKYLEHKIKKW